MDDVTKIWRNFDNGHTFAIDPHGMTLNGSPVDAAPDWVSGDPDMIFGTLKPWRGGECPVSHDVIVRCIFRGRRPYIGKAIWPEMPERGRPYIWTHAPAPGRTDPAYDIVAYQERIA
jgi:hypothetical protein